MSVDDKDKDVVSNRERGVKWDACKSDFPTKCHAVRTITIGRRTNLRKLLVSHGWVTQQQVLL